MSIRTINLVALAACTLPLLACAKSREDLLRDRAAQIEQKLITERDRALADPEAAEHNARLSHLQSLRLSLSAANVSIAAVPFVLKTEDQRTIGYSVLDEALGTIDWNIPLHAPASSASLRPYPTLFSPFSGLDFNAIQRGDTPPGIAR